MGTGSTDASTWYDAVWLSQDESLAGGGAGFPDVFLGSTLNASFLNPGESYNNSLTVTLPRKAEGLYYFLVKTDSFSHVFEFGNEDDNVGSGSQTDVQVTPPPDLQVTAADAPLATFSGQPMILSWTVTNRGQRGTAEGFWHDSFFMSADTALDGTDYPLGNLRHVGDLEPDQAYNASTTLTLPIGVSGDFFFLVHTDAFNRVYEDLFDDNNVGYDSVTTTVLLTPPPDLEVELVDAPDTAKGSQQLTIAYRVANNGSTPTPNSSWTEAFYLSASTTLDTGAALLLGSRAHSGAMADGTFFTSTASFRLPANLDGDFYAFVVTDSRGEVFEAGFTANNVGYDPGTVAICACPPDLVLETVDAPLSALAGHEIAISYRVGNNGTSTTPNASWTDAFYLSATTTLDTTVALPLGRRIRSGPLDVGQLSTTSVDFKLPVGLSGDFYVFVVVDSGNGVFEGSSEANNRGFDPTPVEVISRPPDLVVETAHAPGTAAAGSGILVEWTVANQGNGGTVVAEWGGHHLCVHRRRAGQRHSTGPDSAQRHTGSRAVLFPKQPGRRALRPERPIPTLRGDRRPRQRL